MSVRLLNPGNKSVTAAFPDQSKELSSPTYTLRQRPFSCSQEATQQSMNGVALCHGCRLPHPATGSQRQLDTKASLSH